MILNSSKIDTADTCSETPPPCHLDMHKVLAVMSPKGRGRQGSY